MNDDEKQISLIVAAIAMHAMLSNSLTTPEYVASEAMGYSEALLREWKKRNGL